MFNFLAIVLVATCVVAYPFDTSSYLDDEWATFKTTFKKNYEKESEEYFRRLVWEKNHLFVLAHNSAAKQKKVHYTVAMNKYGDLTHKEFVEIMNGYKGSGKTSLKSGSVDSDDTLVYLPKTVDWRDEGYVTPVKDQKECGSCYAFSSTGSLEGQHFRKTGKLVSLSEQNIIDCSGPEGNNGCNGGLMDQAFQYIQLNGGIDTEYAYPYEAITKDCRFVKNGTGATDIGFHDIESGSEYKLQKAVAHIGPVSVAIDASDVQFRFYKSGVYYNSECSDENLDHGVLVVGYGVDEKDESVTDYWLVKNSWGETWGEEGYIKMARNMDNNCGIATKASYPLV
ncbi:cathepsin L1 [Octopus sinensis]|uniref:Cathepsin L1 n=1 Tax=Octopus sinensis TaxID=2607531 RepID=A0A6P7T2Q4_9MOLL|nr:cathepsin L1 [Octopus sinensis]